jgi:hypothetical protein
MFERRGRRLACVLVAFALSPWVSAAADPPTPAQSNENTKRATTKAEDAEVEADDELLEFLGSVDSEDGELIDYYSKADGAKAPPAAKRVPDQTTTKHE